MPSVKVLVYCCGVYYLTFIGKMWVPQYAERMMGLHGFALIFRFFIRQNCGTLLQSPVTRTFLPRFKSNTFLIPKNLSSQGTTRFQPFIPLEQLILLTGCRTRLNFLFYLTMFRRTQLLAINGMLAKVQSRNPPRNHFLSIAIKQQDAFRPRKQT